jgi:hypothetical protein
MIFLGIILIVVSGLLLFNYRQQTNRAFRLKAARSVTVAEMETTAQAIAQEIGSGDWRDYVKVWGTIVADTPLTSELKPQPCVSYTVSVVREYEETQQTKDADGKTQTETHRGSETISRQQQSIPFWLQDETGRIQINPDGADMETIEVLDQFQPGEPSGGLLSFGNFRLTVGSSPPEHRRTLGYRYRESVLPVNRSALVVGMVSDLNNTLTIAQPTESGKPFIISLKNHETLASNAERNAQTLLYISIACGLAGLVAIIWGLLS